MTSVWTANPVVGDPDSIPLVELDNGLLKWHGKFWLTLILGLQQIKVPKRATSPLIDAIAGGISGMVGVMAGSPIDVIKVNQIFTQSNLILKGTNAK